MDLEPMQPLQRDAQEREARQSPPTNDQMAPSNPKCERFAGFFLVLTHGVLYSARMTGGSSR